ncbi:hypothetical protein [Glycomyces arizonensis]|uniref:hypothetical protein n=1 Tax=Glycomyces arizonensis TaxID=256035 RepID=UPI00047A7EB7|nr:hypothetical protein [Glycomyces arizonensis]
MAAVAACGASGGSGGSEDSPSIMLPTAGPVTETTEPTEPPSTDPEETQMPGETPYLDPSMGSDEPTSNAAMTISGTIESGVESGCLVMTYNGTVYGIFGTYDKSVVHAGAEVTLHGHLDRGMMSFCQQGTPFVVEEAESAG